MNEKRALKIADEYGQSHDDEFGAALYYLAARVRSLTINLKKASIPSPAREDLAKVAREFHDNVHGNGGHCYSSFGHPSRCQLVKVLESSPPAREDGPCHFCGQQTESLAGNPSRWPVVFCHSDNSGVPKVQHAGCLAERVSKSKSEAEIRAETWVEAAKLSYELFGYSAFNAAAHAKAKSLRAGNGKKI